MHHIKRASLITTDTEEEKQAKLAREQQRLSELLALQEQFYANKRAAKRDKESLEVSTKLVVANPDFQTGWNERRHIIDAVGGYEQDLDVVNLCLKKNTKVYCVWEYRKWLLSHLPESFIADELKLVEFYLSRDERNFHAWDYRRYVVSQLDSGDPELPKRELKYTTKKIKSSYSNYSAWHYRSSYLWRAELNLSLSEDVNIASVPVSNVEAIVQKELVFVTDALWSDPHDQSAWLYHRWLFSHINNTSIIENELESLKELREEEPGARATLQAIEYLTERLISLSTQPDATGRLQSQRKELLTELIRIDPQRKGRYHDKLAAL